MNTADRLGLGAEECVAIVGGGGTSTILLTLGREAHGSTKRVVLTTTTHLGSDQVTDPVVWSPDPFTVDAALEPGHPLFVVTARAGHKVKGITAVDADRLVAGTGLDWLIVEADGARRMPFKAPAPHEPPIPRSASTVVVVVGIDAVGRPAEEVAHRPEIVAELTGTPPTVPLSVGDIGTVLLSEAGGLKNIPGGARVVMAVSKVDAATEPVSRELATHLDAHPRVERVVSFERTT